MTGFYATSFETCTKSRRIHREPLTCPEKLPMQANMEGQMSTECFPADVALGLLQDILFRLQILRLIALFVVSEDDFPCTSSPTANSSPILSCRFSFAFAIPTFMSF